MCHEQCALNHDATESASIVPCVINKLTTPVEFRRDLWHQKTRLPGLSCGVVCVILRCAVLVEQTQTQTLVTDTDGQTQRQTQAHG